MQYNQQNCPVCSMITSFDCNNPNCPHCGSMMKSQIINEQGEILYE